MDNIGSKIAEVGELGGGVTELAEDVIVDPNLSPTKALTVWLCRKL